MPAEQPRKKDYKMRKIKIVADTSCDLFALEGVAFAAAPMKIITAEKEFVDEPHWMLTGWWSIWKNIRANPNPSVPIRTIGFARSEMRMIFSVSRSQVRFREAIIPLVTQNSSMKPSMRGRAFL